MKASSGEYIGCEEEKRLIKYYDVIVNYKEEAEKIRHFSVTSQEGNAFAKCTYEQDALIYYVNRGQISFNPESDQKSDPFNYCVACNRWITSKSIEKHLTLGTSQTCTNDGIEADILKDLLLFVKGSHDVIKLHFVCPDDVVEEGERAINEFYRTLKEVLLQSIMLTFNMDERELGGIILPIPESNESKIVIYETEEGGIGALKALISNPIRYTRFLKMMAELIHIKDVTSGEEYEDPCKRACYNCLLGYWNQRDHRYLNRQIVKSLIQAMNTSKIEFISIDPMEAQLERLKNLLGAGLDSFLEKRVLDHMIEMKIPLPHHAQYSIHHTDPSSGRIYILSTADYYYQDKNLCVFVDGPPHNKPEVKHSDEEKRRQLRRKGFGIYEMDFHTGIEEGQNVSDELIEKRLKEFKNYTF